MAASRGPLFALPLVLALALSSAHADASGTSSSEVATAGTGPESLWVLLVGTSRNWLNYRDNSNTVAIYRLLRRMGVPDSNIILMLGHSMACDPRNPHPGELYHHPDHTWDLYGEPMEVDYRGAEVTVDAFLRVLTGQHFPGTPRGKQLRSDSNSRVLVYLTGHGGDKFLKFQDKEELQAQDLAQALHLMHLQGRYRSVLLLADTCQADTMLSQLRSPGVVGIASSAKGENSYSYLPDSDLGVSVVDRFTFQLLRFVETALRHSAAAALPSQGQEPSLQSLFDAFDPAFLQATPCLRKDLSLLPLQQVSALQYFVWPPLYRAIASEGTDALESLGAAAEALEAAEAEDLLLDLGGTHTWLLHGEGKDEGWEADAAGSTNGWARSGQADDGVWVNVVLAAWLLSLAAASSLTMLWRR